MGTGFCTQARSCSFETIHTEASQHRLHTKQKPTILLLLCPVEELVDHVDGRVRRVDAGVGGAQMNWVRVQAERLAVSVVVIGERALHVLKCGRIVDRRFAVRVVPMDRRQRKET